jgi:hypothetical protein
MAALVIGGEDRRKRRYVGLDRVADDRIVVGLQQARS